MALPKQVQKMVTDANAVAEVIGQDVQRANEAKKEELASLLASVTPAEAPAPAAAEAPAPERPREDWKQKYSVLQGKYDAEVPRLYGQVRELTQKVEAFSASAPPEREMRQAPSASYLTPEELEEYGPEMIDVVGRRAKEIVETELSPVIKELRSEIGSLKGQLNQTGQRQRVTDQQMVFAQLDREVSGWRQTNSDPFFLDWLDKYDPYTGDPRKEMLMRAFEKGNVARVAAFFNGFKQENAAVRQSTGQAAPPEGDQARLSLDGLVAPGNSRGGTQPSAPNVQKRIWTQAEISQFYTDVQRGHFKGRDAEKGRIERDMVQAGREGRVR